MTRPHPIAFFFLACAFSCAASQKPPTHRPVPITIGYCAGAKLDVIAQTRDAGFDFAETSIKDLAAMSEPDFAAFSAQIRALGLPILSAVNFLPADLKVVGPTLDFDRQNAYLTLSLTRAAALGLRMVVLGSGGARKIPEGFERAQAFAQLAEFGRRAATIAATHKLSIIVESLRSEETNLINTAAEALALVKEVWSIIVEARDHIRHVQIANPNKRTFPMADTESDYAGFFARLRDIGYRGAISIEAGTKAFATDGPRARAFLRSYADKLEAAPH